jgi:hypothetical protein
MIKLKIRDANDLFWDRLGDKWLVGRVAAALFTASAVGSVGIAVALPLFVLYRGSGSSSSPPLAVAFVLVILGMLFLTAGMQRYWARCDQGSKMARRIWFFVLTFGVFLGAALYCMVVYLPQVRRDWRAQ